MIGQELCRILTLDGSESSPSVYGFPVRPGDLVDGKPGSRRRLGIEIVPEAGGDPIPVDYQVQLYHHGGDDEDPEGVTLFLPPLPPQRWIVRTRRPWFVSKDGSLLEAAEDAQAVAYEPPEPPRKRGIEDLIGARIVDADHGLLRFHCERIGPDDGANGASSENLPTFCGLSMVRWEAQGWLRNTRGEPIVLAWVTLTTWRHTSAVHVEVHVRNQAPRGRKWGTRLLQSIAFEPFTGWRFGVTDLWSVGYRSSSSGNRETARLEVFQAEGQNHFPMAEADGILVQFVAYRAKANAWRGGEETGFLSALEQPFGVEDAWSRVGWGYTDGTLPPPEAWAQENDPPRLKPLYSELWWVIRANDSSGWDDGDVYSIPRITCRAEDAWHHRAGAPHRNDFWDVPFAVRPSISTAGYVEDLVHYATSFLELPHQTTIPDPDHPGRLIPWRFKWGQVKDEYPTGRPSVRRHAFDVDEVSFAQSPRRWMVWENKGSNMTLDREHADLACLVQYLLVTGKPAARRFIESRHFMTGLLPDGAGADPASSDRMLAWYLQHHVEAARVCRDRGEAKRRLEVGLRCLEVNAKLAGKINQGSDGIIDAPTVSGKVPQVMFLTATWSGWAGWMVALQWQCGILPLLRAAVQAGLLKAEDFLRYRKLIIDTVRFEAQRDTYYLHGALNGFPYKLEPHGAETIDRAFGAVEWGEGLGKPAQGLGEAYHPTESRIVLNGSGVWYAGWCALDRFVPRSVLPDWVWKHQLEVSKVHLTRLRDEHRLSGFHPYRASAWRFITGDPNAINLTAAAMSLSPIHEELDELTKAEPVELMSGTGFETEDGEPNG